ncbi:hypothetical protein CH267_01065 [Rhodococcus sp. 06-621-2]|nr:hypothetical protein [Rhodococcus sp. 06-621-2]OZC62164.1 hypothetical protein CH267_01065 [Rhodococcus sp. 06-621-2]
MGVLDAPAWGFDAGIKLDRRIRNRGLDATETDIVGNGTADDRAAIQAAMNRVSLASNGDPMSLFLPRGDYRCTRPSPTATECLVAPSNIELRFGLGALLYLDPATVSSTTGMTFLAIGTTSGGSSNVRIVGPGTIRANHQVINQGMDANGNSPLGGARSIWGVMARQTHASPMHSDNVYIGGGLRIEDTRVALGANKSYNMYWNTEANQKEFHQNWTIEDVVLDTCTNKIMEFIEISHLRMRRVHIPKCFSGPQFLFMANDILAEDFYVRYLDGGLRVGHGAYDARFKDWNVAPHSTVGSGSASGALILGLEPQADTVDTRDIVIDGGVYRDQATAAKRALRMQGSAGPVAATFRRISAINGAVFDGDVDLRLPAATASVTTLQDVDLGRQSVRGGSTYRDPRTAAGFPTVRRGGIVTEEKTVDESVTSSTVQQDDDELFTYLDPGSYDVRLGLIVDGSQTGDIKIGFAGTAGATFNWGGTTPTSGVTSDTAAVNWLARTLADTQIAGARGAGIPAMIPIVGRLKVTTAGRFGLQWSQGTSDATATIVKAGSWITAERVA